MGRAYLKSRTTGKKYYLSDLAKELGLDETYYNQFNDASPGGNCPSLNPIIEALKTKNPALDSEFYGQVVAVEKNEND